MRRTSGGTGARVLRLFSEIRLKSFRTIENHRVEIISEKESARAVARLRERFDITIELAYRCARVCVGYRARIRGMITYPSPDTGK